MTKFYIITEDEAVTLEILDRQWEEDAVCPVKAGLYLTCGDGVAVEVTAETLAKARWSEHIEWHRISDRSRADELAKAQEDLDALFSALSEQIDA